MIDAIVPLVQLPSVEGIQTVSRAFFEAKCSLEYMIQDQMEVRAIAYQTQHIINRIRSYKNMDPQTSFGKEMLRKWERNQTVHNVPFPGKDTSLEIKNLQDQLAREPYKSVHDELKRYKQARWYSLYNGPRSFEDLCCALGHELYYELYYRTWSASTHTQAVFIDSFFVEDGEGYMHAIRSLSGYHETIGHVLPLIVDFYTKIFGKLMPNEMKLFARFYKNQYRDKWWAFFGETKPKTSLR